MTPSSRLAAALGTTTLDVNSTHHQLANALGRDLVVSGQAPDGAIEAIGRPSGAFVLGVQWHPELLATPLHDRIYAALVQAARHHRERR